MPAKALARTTARRRTQTGWQLCLLGCLGWCAMSCASVSAAERTTTNPVICSARGENHALLNPVASANESAARVRRDSASRRRVPVDDSAYSNQRRQPRFRAVKLQTPQPPSEGELPPPSAQQNPCSGLADKPLNELGINVKLPEGKLPDDLAAACWEQLNETAGPLAAMRLWPVFVYSWNATCLCHRPLYFEETNLERHGYGCCECFQVGVSAAHFFGTIPALPYCMAAECPCECVYTLGHYRPGSCPPWRHHWPPCDPLAAAAEGGVWTGLIFLFP